MARSEEITVRGDVGLAREEFPLFQRLVEALESIAESLKQTPPKTSDRDGIIEGK